MRPGVIEKTVRNGALSIDVLHYADGRYGFEYRPKDEERVRVRLHDLEAAVARARTALGATHAGKLDLLAIDPAEFAEFLQWKAQRKPSVTIPALVETYLASRQAKGRSFARLRELRGALEPFALAFPGTLADPTRDQVEAWLNQRPVGPRRWNNLREAIVSLYRFARRSGYLSADLTPVELIEPKKVTVTVETYSPAELLGYLRAVPREWRPLIVLQAFAGLRPEELCPESRGAKPRLQWENILWEKAKIDVPRAVSKVRRRRFVPLLPAAAALLAPWRDATGPCVPFRSTLLYKRTPLWSAATGIPWKPDGWRHSYASYRLAVLKDIQELSLEMGNSARMIHLHYLDLKHDEEAAHWFALRPADLTKNNSKDTQKTRVPKGRSPVEFVV